MLQAMEGSYEELAQQLQGSHMRVAKFQADTDREFAQERFGLKTFPTIVMLPKPGNQVPSLTASIQNPDCGPQSSADSSCSRCLFGLGNTDDRRQHESVGPSQAPHCSFLNWRRNPKP